MGVSRGGPKKGPKLSRLGELLNTQKNVHFLAPRAPRGPGAQNVHPGGYPLDPPFDCKIPLEMVPKGPILGAHTGGPRRAPGGAPGAPGGPGPGGRKFPPAGPRGAPGPGGPGRGSWLGTR